MARASHTVVIARPVDEVFAFVADGEKCLEWRPGVLDIRRVSGEGVGTRYAQSVAGPMGRRIAADYEITAYEPNRRIEFQTIAGPVRPQGRYDFTPTGVGTTQLTFALKASVGGRRGLVMGPMVQRTMDGEVRSLERVKEILEA